MLTGPLTGGPKTPFSSIPASLFQHFLPGMEESVSDWFLFIFAGFNVNFLDGTDLSPAFYHGNGNDASYRFR